MSYREIRQSILGKSPPTERDRAQSLTRSGGSAHSPTPASFAAVTEQLLPHESFDELEQQRLVAETALALHKALVWDQMMRRRLATQHQEPPAEPDKSWFVQRELSLARDFQDAGNLDGALAAVHKAAELAGYLGGSGGGGHVVNVNFAQLVQQIEAEEQPKLIEGSADDR